MPYESPILDIVNFDVRGAGDSATQGNVCSPVTPGIPFPGM